MLLLSLFFVKFMFMMEIRLVIVIGIILFREFLFIFKCDKLVKLLSVVGKDFVSWFFD